MTDEKTPPPLPEEPAPARLRRNVVVESLFKVRAHRRASIAAALALALSAAAFLGAPVAEALFSARADGARPPGLAHPFGTGVDGGDLLVQVLLGLRTSLSVAALATLVAVLVGAPLGAWAAASGRRLDHVLMRLVDFLSALPGLLLLILVMAVAHGLADADVVVAGAPLSPTLILVASLGLLHGLTMARVTRGLVYGLRRRGFVLAARAWGLSRAATAARHVVPHAIGPLVVYAALAAPLVVVEEAFLSFLDLGVLAPRVSLGALAQRGLDAMAVHPWMLVFPSGALVVLVLSLHLLADGLRDALDPPKSRE